MTSLNEHPLPLGLDVHYDADQGLMSLMVNGHIIAVLSENPTALNVLSKLITILKSERDAALDHMEGLERLMKGFPNAISR